MIKKEASGIPFEWNFTVRLQVGCPNHDPSDKVRTMVVSLDGLCRGSSQVFGIDLTDEAWKHFSQNIENHLAESLADLLFESVGVGARSVDRPLSQEQITGLLHEVEDRKKDLAQKIKPSKKREDSGYFRRKMRKAIAELLRKGDKPTQEAVARHIHSGLDTIRANLKRYKIHWEDLKKEGLELSKYNLTRK